MGAYGVAHGRSWLKMHSRSLDHTEVLESQADIVGRIGIDKEQRSLRQRIGGRSNS